MELNLYIQFAVFTLLFSFTFFEAFGYTPKLWDKQQSCSSLNRRGNRNIQDKQNCPVLQSLTVTKLKKNEEFWTFKLLVRFVIQLLSCVQLLVTPWTAACQASLFFTISQSLRKLMSIDCVSDAVQPSPLSSPSPLALNLSQHQGLFQWVSSSNKVARVLEFQLQH